MADTEFFKTIMGHKFYEGTMPALVHELKKLNENLEKLVEVSIYGSPKDTVMETCGRCGVPADKPLSEVLKAFERFRAEHTTKADPGPTSIDPERFKDVLSIAVSQGRNSGEAAGRLVVEHLNDMRSEDPDVIIEELANIEEWASSIRKRLA